MAFKLDLHMANLLEQLEAMTIIVADSGDIEAITITGCRSARGMMSHSLLGAARHGQKVSDWPDIEQVVSRDRT